MNNTKWRVIKRDTCDLLPYATPLVALKQERRALPKPKPQAHPKTKCLAPSLFQHTRPQIVAQCVKVSATAVSMNAMPASSGASPPGQNRLWHSSCGINFSPKLVPAPPVLPLSAHRQLDTSLFGTIIPRQTALRNDSSMARPAPRLDLTWKMSSGIKFAHVDKNGAAKTPLSGKRVSKRGFGTVTPSMSSSQEDSSSDYSPDKVDEEEEIESFGYDSRSDDKVQPACNSSGSAAGSWVKNATDMEKQERYQPLTYQISTSELESARKNKSGDVWWTWALYRSPAGDRVQRHYCSTKEQSERVAALMLGEKMLGFDLEWKAHHLGGNNNTFKDRVSTIQLASETRVSLFHVALHKGSTPEEVLSPSLRHILESTEILKAGVNVRGDMNRLKKYWNLNAVGYFELSHLYKLVHYSETQPELVNKKLVRLAQQTQELLGLPLAKDDVRVSDWSQKLSVDQIDYACSDAYAAVHLFGVLNSRRQRMADTPPLPDFIENDTPIRFTVRTQAGESQEVQSRDNSEAESDGADEDYFQAPTRMQASDVKPTAASSSVEEDTRERMQPDAEPRTEVSAFVSSARSWAEQYRLQKVETGRPSRASNSHLVAYRLWHEQQLSIAHVAAYMSKRPLQLSTVSSYVLECIRLEKLPYEQARLNECLSNLPRHITGGGRYSWMMNTSRQQHQHQHQHQHQQE